MAQPYQLVTPWPGAEVNAVERMADGAVIPFDDANKDFVIYLQWCDDGNTPDPAPP